MRSIKRRLKNIQNKNPYWSSYICFVEAIKGQDFSKQTIHRQFNKIVDKSDYDKNDKKTLLKQLRKISQNG